MPLTEEQRKVAADALQTRVKNPCPSCGSRSFTIADVVSALPFDPNGPLVIGGPTVPILLVICENCALLIPFSAVKLGLVTP